MALPGIAVVVGPVAHVVAGEIDKEAVLGVTAEILGNHAVARDAGAHTHGGTLLELARDVGVPGAAADGAQEHVVGVVAVLAARVALDVADAAHVGIVVVAHKDAAALVVLSLQVAGVFGDGATIDGALFGIEADAAAVLIGRVARNGALGDGRRLLVELDTAAVVGGVVVADLEALDDARVTGFVANVDAAAARIVLRGEGGGSVCLVVRDGPRLVFRDEGETGSADDDAATAGGRDVAVKGAVVVQGDLVVRAVHEDAAATRGTVRVHSRVIDGDGDVVRSGVDATARGARAVVLHLCAARKLDGAAIGRTDAGTAGGLV